MVLKDRHCTKYKSTFGPQISSGRGPGGKFLSYKHGLYLWKKKILS